MSTTIEDLSDMEDEYEQEIDQEVETEISDNVSENTNDILDSIKQKSIKLEKYFYIKDTVLITALVMLLSNEYILRILRILIPVPSNISLGVLIGLIYILIRNFI